MRGRRVHSKDAWSLMRGAMVPKFVARERLRMVRRIKRIRRHDYHRGVIGRVALLAVFSGLVTVGGLLLVGELVEAITRPAGGWPLVALTAAVVATTAVDAIIRLVARHLAARAGEDLALKLRQRLVAYLTTVGLDFFTSEEQQRTVSGVNHALAAVQQSYVPAISDMVVNQVQAVVFLAILVVLSWPLGLVATGVLGVLFLFSWRAARTAARLQSESAEVAADLNEWLADRMSPAGAMTIRLSRDEQEWDIFLSRAHRSANRSVATRFHSAFHATVLTVLFSIALGAVYVGGGFLVLWGTMSPGLVVVIGLFFGRLALAATAVLNGMVNAAYVWRALPGLIRFLHADEVFDGSPPEGERRLPAGPVAVRFDQVWFSGGSDRLAPRVANEVGDLRGVSFVVKPGTMTALVGPDDTAKTAVLALSAGLYRPDSGRVLLAQVDTAELTRESLRGAVGLLSQDVHVFPGTLLSNANYGLENDDPARTVAALREAGLGPLVESLPDGEHTRIGPYARPLASHERLRLAVARLLLTNPPVVILDERTIHLSSANDTGVRAAISRGIRGRTVLAVACQPHTLRQADQVLHFRDGRIVERRGRDPVIRAT